jgi:hypothetical protein
MRTRKEILNDPKQTEFLILEVLLDIRDLFTIVPSKPQKKRGRPKKKTESV